jgi:hypothetical protein
MAIPMQSPWWAATQELTNQEENMTQLNLSGRPSSDKSQNSTKEPRDGSITNQTVGALGALAMFAAVIVIGSCTGSSKPVVVQQPTQPVAPVSAPAVATPAPVPAPVQAKAKSRKRRPTTVSYVNPEYGVSFSFPRQYSLKSGDAAQLSWGDLGPFQMDFVQPGGMTLAGVQLPDHAYPGSDFKSAFVNLSVNPRMTSAACGQFAFPEAKTAGGTSPAGTGEETITASETSGKESKAADKPALSQVEGSVRSTNTTVKIGEVEFTEVETSTPVAMQQTDAKYYHAFNNGACYEFALGIATEGGGSVEGVKPVDRQEVFGKLEKILATVKFKPAAAPEAEVPAPSAKEAASDASANTQGQSAIDRMF